MITDSDFRDIISDCANSLVLAEGESFLEKYVDQALVAALSRRLGDYVVPQGQSWSGLALPDWSPRPGPLDVRILDEEGRIVMGVECKVDQIWQMLWDAYKLTALQSIEGVEHGYLVGAATSATFSKAGTCAEWFAQPSGEAVEYESAELFDHWAPSWAALLKGGSGRPQRVPARIRVTHIATAEVPVRPGYELRAVAIEAVPDGDWLLFDGKGWPAAAKAKPTDELPTPATLSRRFDEALHYACVVHGGQVRKGTGIPYFSHLLAVTGLVLEDGGSEDEAIAALLHDAAEDGGGLERLSDIRARFGDLVSEIVIGCTDTLEDPKPDWRPRKETYLARLPLEPEPVLRVSAADKLHNLRAMWADFEREGDALFVRFRAGKDDQAWYFAELARIYRERLPRSRSGIEFCRLAELASSTWLPQTT